MDMERRGQWGVGGAGADQEFVFAGEQGPGVFLDVEDREVEGRES